MDAVIPSVARDLPKMESLFAGDPSPEPVDGALGMTTV